MSQPMKLRPSAIGARSTTKPPAAGSTTRSPGFVTAPIKPPSSAETGYQSDGFALRLACILNPPLDGGTKRHPQVPLSIQAAASRALRHSAAASWLINVREPTFIVIGPHPSRFIL